MKFSVLRCKWIRWKLENIEMCFGNNLNKSLLEESLEKKEIFNIE